MRNTTDLIMAECYYEQCERRLQNIGVFGGRALGKEMVNHRHFVRILAKFDVVMLYYSQTVKPLSNQIERRCIFLPPGVDAILFCPHPSPLKRVIDVYSMGRRSQITHQRLLRMVQESGIFYLHDSISGDLAINAKEHRAFLANIAKRSRYFIVNPGKIDKQE